MRLVFMGTPEFARACLEKLHSDGFDIAAVYTKIDTPKNRGMKLIPSPVKEYAQSVGLPVYQPQSFRDEETVQQLRELKPDLLVVVAYGKILPQTVLDIPKYGAINMHGSILPQLRGSAPVQRSILNHCDEAGVTAMYLSAGMDEGDIIEIRKTAIQPLETSEELMARLAQLAAPLCADTVRSIEAGTGSAHPAGQRPRDLRAHAVQGGKAPSTGTSPRDSLSTTCAALSRGPSPRRSLAARNLKFTAWNMPIKKRRKPQVRSSR